MKDATATLLAVHDVLQRLGLSVIVLGDNPAEYTQSIATADRQVEARLEILPGSGDMLIGTVRWVRGPMVRTGGNTDHWQAKPGLDFRVRLKIALAPLATDLDFPSFPEGAPEPTAGAQ